MNASILKTMTIKLDLAAAKRFQTPQLKVEYGIRVIKDQPGYFTLTGELDEISGAIQISGAIHNEIIEIEPFFTLLSQLHLSHATTGEPMHAVANAWYFIQDSDYTAAARLLRCSTVRVRECTSLNDVKRLATDLAPQWRAEAELARLTYDLGPAAAPAVAGAFNAESEQSLVDYIMPQIQMGAEAEEITQAIIEQMSIIEDIEEAIIEFGTEFGTEDDDQLAREIVRHLTHKFQR